MSPAPQDGLSRRTLLRGGATLALAAGAAACSRAEQVTLPTQHTVLPSSSAPGNPFGAPRGSTVDLWVDDGHLPRAWADDLARSVRRSPAGLDVQVHATSQVGADLAPRFQAGNPPDLVLDAGADLIGLSGLAPELADLAGVLGAGPGSLRESLRPGAVTAGTVQGRVVAVPTGWPVHGLWYSSRLLRQHGWVPPATLDQMHQLGREARAIGIDLLDWGRDSATWLLRMALSAAVRQGGLQVLRALENLEPDAWRQATVQQALAGVHRLVVDRMVRPGGSGTSWRKQLTRFTGQQVLLVAGGPWVAAQARADAGFGLTVAPDPALDQHPALGQAALHAGPGGMVVLPRDAANPAGAREVLRQLLQPGVAAARAARTLVPSSVSRALPANPPAALQQQYRLLQAAGQQVFNLRCIDFYGTNHDHQALWNAFLEGRMDVRTLTAESQRITDQVAADPSLPKVRLP